MTMGADRRPRTSRAPLMLTAMALALCGFWLLHSNPGISMASMITSPTKPSFAPHFPGDYGSQALANLSDWSSTLFERTMVALREATRASCASGNPECELAKTYHRSDEPRSFRKYDLFDPFVACPGGNAPQRMGGQSNFSDDGGKWLCMDLLQPPCTIFSLGSNGDFTFEESMLNATQCFIHTYDCTYAGASIHPRHQYHKQCLGSAAKAAADPAFVTLEAATAAAGGAKINLLKIDIEGFEYDALSTWAQGEGGLPEQVAIEVHHSEVIYWGTASVGKEDDFSNLLWPLHNVGQSDLALFFGHLGGLGYGVVSREDNPMGNCCSEFLLLKVGDWTPGLGRGGPAAAAGAGAGTGAYTRKLI